MFHHEYPSVNLAAQDSVGNGQSDLFRQIVKNPDVVIAFEPYNFGSLIGKLCQRSEEAYIAAWHHRAVFVPIIQYVAEKV